MESKIKTIRAGIYARVSTTEQDPAYQIEALKKYCENREWIVLAEYTDFASGSLTDRRERKNIITLAKQRLIDAVVVWKLDRWGRSTQDVINTIQELQSVGVTFVSITEAIDISTPLGKMFLAVIAALGEFERDLIQERIAAGVKRYRSLNSNWGRPPISKEKKDQVRELYALQWNKKKIARTVGLSHTSVHRIIKESE